MTRYGRAILRSAPRAATKERVREYWDRSPCGAKHSNAPSGSLRFFRDVEAERHRLEPFIADYARFDDARGKRLLEIGTGLGTDFVRFGRAGACLTGIDLTQRAVELVRRRLVLEGLDGDVLIADAEALPFEDESFDIVYSWGVIHHTPSPERAMTEAVRVLRRGGYLCVMVYAKHSWVAYGLWARYALAAGRPWHSLNRVIGDHMESAGTQAFTRRQVELAFSGLQQLQVEHVATPYDRRVAGRIAMWSGVKLGWFLVARGRK